MAPSDQTGWLCCGVQITTQLSYFHIKSGTVSSCVAIERKAFFCPLANWLYWFWCCCTKSTIYGSNRKVEIMETAQYFGFHDEPVSISR